MAMTIEENKGGHRFIKWKYGRNQRYEQLMWIKPNPEITEDWMVPCVQNSKVIVTKNGGLVLVPSPGDCFQTTVITSENDNIPDSLKVEGTTITKVLPFPPLKEGDMHKFLLIFNVFSENPVSVIWEKRNKEFHFVFTPDGRFEDLSEDVVEVIL